jgi:hypothetical protein
VHQNNINMEGFRYLQVGERVTYELEVGEKGMKAVSVSLSEPRQPRPDRPEEGGEFDEPQQPQGEPEADFRPRPAARPPRPPRAPRGESDGHGQVEKLRRKQERLITLLVEKGILAPGDIDGFEEAAPKSIENQQA